VRVLFDSFFSRVAMSAPRQRPDFAADLGVSDFTQEIESPFSESLVGRDEPTLTKIDFDDIELALDF
jgi:hypothetical protein